MTQQLDKQVTLYNATVRWYNFCVPCICRAQDQAAIQLSAMEEEMDQRIQQTERNTRMEVGTALEKIQPLGCLKSCNCSLHEDKDIYLRKNKRY